MNSLGIYFGPKLISIVESKGRLLLNSVQVSQSVVTAGELEEKVPSEVKIVALFKDELRKNNIQANEASLVLSGKDLIIRTFEMPIVPANELENAVRFEAKKYIPFRIEDLIIDFQVQFDKAIKKNLILFVGIKKEVLDKYHTILTQLDLKPVAIEYAAFSILRLLKSSGCSDRGIVSVISVDFREEDEVNFTVLENGFPLFSRDITLVGGPDEFGPPKERDAAALLEKLKTEIRVSLDYYHRKFPSKNISKAFFVTSQDFRSELAAFMKEMDLIAHFVEVSKVTGKTAPFSLSIIKGYSASLTKTVKSNLKINLLAAKEKVKKKEGTPTAAVAAAEILPSLFSGLKLNPRFVALGILICAVTFAYGIINKQPLIKEVNDIIAMRPKVPGVNTTLPNDGLSKISGEYNRKLETLDNLLRSQVYLTKIIEGIARVKPDGIWVKSINFKKEENKAELSLEGMTYLTDSDKEFALVNKYLSNLKENPVISKYFKEINIVSLDHQEFKSATVTTFSITARFAKKE